MFALHRLCICMTQKQLLPWGSHIMRHDGRHRMTVAGWNKVVALFQLLGYTDDSKMGPTEIEQSPWPDYYYYCHSVVITRFPSSCPGLFRMLQPGRRQSINIFCEVASCR